MYKILKIVAFCILICSSISKLLNSEYFEFALVEAGLSNWFYSPLTIKAIILTEFTLAFSLLFNSINKKIFSLLLFTLCIIYFLDIINKVDNGMFMSYYTLSQFYNWLSILSLVILLLTAGWSFFDRSPKPNRKGIKTALINLSILLVITVPSFIFSPIFIDDFQTYNTSVENPKSDWSHIYEECEKSGIDVNSDSTTFFAFFSTTCYYCNRAAIRIGVSGIKRKNTTPIIMVFPGNEEDTQNFIKRNNSNYPYIRISKEEFQAIAGNEFPAFFKVKNKKETNYYTGRTLSFPEIDNLFE